MAGRGSYGCGVELHYSFAELREVASEECPTGIGELGVKRARGVDLDGVAVGFRASGAFFAFVRFWPNCCYNKPMIRRESRA